jgi:hypothetical protein
VRNAFNKREIKTKRKKRVPKENRNNAERKISEN